MVTIGELWTFCNLQPGSEESVPTLCQSVYGMYVAAAALEIAIL
jgi:hypothetical protein